MAKGLVQHRDGWTLGNMDLGWLGRILRKVGCRILSGQCGGAPFRQSVCIRVRIGHVGASAQ
eukprot:1697212-Prymnesium_polylepis.1